MNAQEMIDSRVRHLIGDLQIQLIFAQAQIAELQEQLAAKPAAEAPKTKNGAAKQEAEHGEEAANDHTHQPG